MTILKRIKSEALKILLPWACAGCRTALSSIEDEGFCGPCWLRIPRIQGLVCRACGIPLKEGGSFCFTCRTRPIKLFLRAATTYTGAMPSAIHRFKYTGRRSLAASFGLLLKYAWDHTEEFARADVLVPIPLHPSAEQARGYNQSQLLAKAFAGRIGKPVISDAVVRWRRTTPQFRLSKEQRLRNLLNAFTLGEQSRALRGKRVLLIDDVGTTGATLAEVARIARTAGSLWVGGLVLARDL